jgi:hypothetical protein
MNDEVSVELYRVITGACYNGIESWMKNQNLEYKIENEKPVLVNPLKVKDVYELLEKTNAYGFDRFKELVKN